MAIVAGGLVLALSVFLEWGHINDMYYDDGTRTSATASMNGIGDATVTLGGLDPDYVGFVEGSAAAALEDETGSAGVWAIWLGLLVSGAGLAYMGMRVRAAAAVTVAVLALIGFVTALSQMFNVRGAVFDNNVGWSQGEFSAGFGLVLACALTLVLLGLAVTAFVLERLARAAVSTPASARPTEPIPSPGPDPVPPRRPFPPVGPSRAPGMPATFGVRAAAFVLDWVLIGVVVFVVLAMWTVLNSALLQSETARVVWFAGIGVLAWATPVLYFALTEARTGRTVGKWLMGLRVVGREGRLPSVAQAFRRNWIHVLYPLYPIYLVALAALAVEMYAHPEQNPSHQGMHDRLGETRVIFAPASSRAPASGPRPSLVPWFSAVAAVLALMITTAVVDLGVRAASSSASSGSRQSSTTATAPRTTAVNPTTPWRAPSSPAPTTPTRPTTSTTAATRLPTIPGTDAQGFVAVAGGRCNATDPAVLIGRTPQSLVIICQTASGRLYYKGVRLSDSATIEIDDPVRTELGYVVTNEGVQYWIDRDALVITRAGTQLADEPMLQYWAR
ncbi:RDD family protein [Rhodococcus ruber]|uniref:RDD family protein n=1 Tax=Rhodococcus ruber TaxID=1830 RepID=UPI001934A329|nr:RDD family protein [Rhodococcus ruber]QRE81411.1 RDD family protein [Rhodococcus ruber]